MIESLRKSWLALASSILFLAGLAYVIVGRNDLPRVGELLLRIDRGEFVVAVVIMVAVGSIEAFRTRLILKIGGIANTHPLSLWRIALIRQFVAHAAPVSALADAAKAIMLNLRFGLTAARSASCVIYERIIGVLCVAIIGLAVLPLQAGLGVPLWMLAGQMGLWLGGLLVACGFIWFAFRELPAGVRPLDRILRLAHGLGSQLKSPWINLEQVFLMGAQLFGVAVLYAVLAHAMHVSLHLYVVVCFTPLIFFFSSLPIFYVGWGGREAVMIATLGSYSGIATADLFSVSVAFGLVVFVASLPGALLWAMRPSMKKRGEGGSPARGRQASTPQPESG